MQNYQYVQQASCRLLEILSDDYFKSPSPPIGLILGTGLSFIADMLESSPDSRVIPFSEVPHLPAPSVASHAGKFVFGMLNSTPVFAQAGRFHLYEGYKPDQVCLTVRIMGMLGIKSLILTNAAGSINPLFFAGSLLCIADIINHTGVSPLTGPNIKAYGPRFPDMSEVFSGKLQELAISTALAKGISLQRGVYLGVHGPEMETPAETRMYRQWGADAVGMSTVLESICARHMGMNLLGFSCLTNQNLPDCPCEVSLDEIIAYAKKCGSNLGKLLADLVPAIFSCQNSGK